MGVGVAFLCLVALTGAAVGSFINVVVYRLPTGASIVRPASRCPHCLTPIKAHHNIPVLGWFLVRGRCASCQAPISARYPLVELAMALVAVALFHDFAGGLVTPGSLTGEGRDFLLHVVGPFFLYLLFAGGLVAIALIDLDWFIIPDAISLPGMVIGVLTAFGFGHAIGVDWQQSLIGAAAGAGVLILVILVYGWLTGREGMGGGDWKLLGLIGAYLGWTALPAVLFAASIQGLLFAVLLRREFAVDEVPPDPADVAAGDAAPAAAAAAEPAESKPFSQLAIPFGPFLAVAALEYLLFRREIRTLITDLLPL